MISIMLCAVVAYQLYNAISNYRLNLSYTGYSNLAIVLLVIFGSKLYYKSNNEVYNIVSTVNDMFTMSDGTVYFPEVNSFDDFKKMILNAAEMQRTSRELCKLKFFNKAHKCAYYISIMISISLGIYTASLLFN